MSQLVENYLHELYLYEELALIDENFISWAKRFKEDKLKKIASKMKEAFDRRDMIKVKKVASKVPKPSVDSLEKMAKKTSPKFKKVSREVSRQLAQRFGAMPDTEARLITFIVALINENSDNIVKAVANTLKKLKKMIKTPKVKKAAGTGEGAIGTVLVIAAAMIGLGAVLSISLPTLLVALLLGGVALAFLMEAVGQHGRG